MKIVIATGIYPPEIGGPATYAYHIVPLLKKAGWTAEIVTYGAHRRGVRAVLRAHSLPVRLFLFTKQLWLSSKKADVIFTLDCFSAGLPAIFVSKLRGIPIVTRFGGIFAYEQEENRGISRSMSAFLNGKKRALIRFLYFTQGIILRNSVQVIANSEFMARVARSQRVLPSRITVVKNAPVVTTLLESKEVLRKKLGLDNSIYLVSVSRLIAHKHVDGIVRMLEQLPLDFKLLVIGSGSQEPLIKEIVVKLKLSKRVRFLGQLPLGKVHEYMKAADGYILNSRYEGLSNTAAEAMAIGTPVFLSKVEGNTDLVKDGENGFLFQFDTAQSMVSQVLKIYEKENIARICSYAQKSLPTWTYVFSKTNEILKRSKR